MAEHSSQRSVSPRSILVSRGNRGGSDDLSRFRAATPVDPKESCAPTPAQAPAPCATRNNFTSLGLSFLLWKVGDGNTLLARLIPNGSRQVLRKIALIAPAPSTGLHNRLTAAQAGALRRSQGCSEECVPPSCLQSCPGHPLGDPSAVKQTYPRSLAVRSCSPKEFCLFCLPLLNEGIYLTL